MDDLGGRPITAADEHVQTMYTPAAELLEVLADGRERRMEERGLGDVVEANDAHVLGHTTPGFVQREEHA